MVKPVEMAVDASVVRVKVRNRRMNLREEIAALERAALAAALDEAGGNASEAARSSARLGAERRAIRAERCAR